MVLLLGMFQGIETKAIDFCLSKLNQSFPVHAAELSGNGAPVAKQVVGQLVPAKGQGDGGGVLLSGQDGEVEHEFFAQGALGQDADLHHEFHVVFGNELHQALHDFQA